MALLTVAGVVPVLACRWSRRTGTLAALMAAALAAALLAIVLPGG